MTIVNAIYEAATPAQCEAKPHDDFMPLKPIVERHAEFVARHLQTADREEFVSEAVAFAFASFVRLKARGKNAVRDFPSMMATYAVLCVRDGRHINNKDVMSQKAQRKHDFCIQSLSRSNRHSLREPQARGGKLDYADAVEEQLYENARTPPAEQAAFRIDYAAWLTGRNHRDRQLIQDLAAGERTGDLARKYRVTLGRISQKRRQFHDSWERFHGERPAKADASVA